MKSRVLMAALVVTLLMGVRVYASDCGPCEPVSDPCGSCDKCSRSCDLFSGLKNLVACSPCSASECGPCDGVVACNPCDEAACNPCDDASCDNNCGRKFTFGKRLKHLFDTRSCNPCDEVGACDVSDDNGCNPCDEIGACDSICGKNDRPLRNLFKGFRLAGRCNDGCGSPCDAIGDCGDNSCNPCDEVGACGEIGACDEVSCDTGCGHKLGHLFDKPRRSVKRFFDGFSFKNTSCNPCDAVSCDPCDAACNSLPEACK